ncbi:MAG: flagellar basal body-associated FliL family protein [Roseburia sp.]
MKKNLITVIILALVLVNLVLTAILTFTIIPQTRKSNQLIDQVCAAINLELAAGKGEEGLNVPIEDIEVYNIANSFTVNLADGGDGKKHIAVFSVGLSLNRKSQGYKAYGGAEGLAEKETIICSEINTIVTSYTREEFEADGYKMIKADILKKMQDMFGGTDFIVGVNFSSVATEQVKK